MLTRLIFCGVIALSSLLTLSPSQTLCSEDPQVRDLGNPLMRVWFPTTLLQDRQKFLDDLSTELQGNLDQQASTPLPDPRSPQSVRHEGLLIYLDPVGDANPDGSRSHFPGNRWLNPIRFMEVANREEFEKNVRERTGMDSATPMGVLVDRDGGLEYIPNRQWRMHRGITAYLEHISRYWRYDKGYMFFGDDESLLTMKLPESNVLKLRGRASERDVFAQIDFDAVVPRKKNRFWDALRHRIERVLQQHDEEDQIDYAFRKAWGELQLQLLRAVTSDLKSIRVSIDFATTQKPAEISLDLIAEPGANLEKYFGKMSLGTRQMAAAIEEPAILTLATAWQLPPNLKNVVNRLIALVNKELVANAGFNADIFIAADELTTALQKSLEGSRELVLKLSRSEQGFTLYGGIQLSEAQRVSKNLELLLNSLTATTSTGVIRSRDASGRLYLSYKPSHLSEFLAQINRERFPAEAHLTVDDSTLWFSFGPPDSLDVLAGLLDRSGEIDQSLKWTLVPALLFDIELDRCLSDQESTRGFDRVPQLALQKINEKLPHRQADFSKLRSVKIYSDPDSYQLNEIEGAVDFGITLPPAKPQSDPPEQVDPERSVIDDYVIASGEWKDLTLSWSPYVPGAIDLNKFLKPDQSRIRAEIETGSRRLRLKLTVGMGPIKHYFAQLSQNSTIQGVIQLWNIDGTSSNLRIRTAPPQQPEAP